MTDVHVVIPHGSTPGVDGYSVSFKDGRAHVWRGSAWVECAVADIEKSIDIADIVAGELGVSRATAYDLMWEAVKQSWQHEARIKATFDLARRWSTNRRTTETRLATLVTGAKDAKKAQLRNDAAFLQALRDL